MWWPKVRVDMRKVAEEMAADLLADRGGFVLDEWQKRLIVRHYAKEQM